MKKSLSITLKILGVLILLAIVGGAAFRIGYGRGAADSPAIAAQIQTWQDKTDKVPAPYPFYNYPGQMMRGGHAPFLMPFGRGGFFSIGRLLGFLFLAFLFFGALRFLFFRRMMHHHGHGHWHGHMPPWAQQPTPQAPAQPENPQGEAK